jgi:hypothetical protein
MRTTAKTLAAAAALLLPLAAAALLPSPAAAAAAGALLQPPARRRDDGGNNRRPWRPQQQQAQQQQQQQQQQHTQTQVLFAGKSAGALPAASVSERGGRGDPRPPVPLPRKGPAIASSFSSRFAAAVAGGSAAGWGGAFFWAAAAASAASSSSESPDEYVYGAVDAPIGLAFGAGVLAIATAALPVLLRSGERAFEEIRERDEGTFGADTRDVLKSKKGGRK